MTDSSPTQLQVEEIRSLKKKLGVVAEMPRTAREARFVLDDLRDMLAKRKLPPAPSQWRPKGSVY